MAMAADQVCLRFDSKSKAAQDAPEVQYFQDAKHTKDAKDAMREPHKARYLFRALDAATT